MLKLVWVFIIWRIWLFGVAFMAIAIFPGFLASFPYADRVLTITEFPQWVWGFGNFDGVHYLKIAQNGYVAQYTQAFFPGYPLAIKVVAEYLFFWMVNPSLDLHIFVDSNYFVSAILLSNLFFILGIYFFYKLLRIDYSEKISFWSTIFLLSFPTAFYFISVYSESLFFLEIVLSLYFARKKQFFMAGIFAACASGTRVLGVLLTPVLIIEYLMVRKSLSENINEKILNILGILISPLGLILYSLYLKINFGDALYFLNAQPFFGAGRSSGLVLLPQVIYRYTAIFATVPVISKVFLSAALEFLFSIIPITALILLFRKIRLSYWIFVFGCLLVPTLTGTFSSMPRYALMSFLLFPELVKMFGNKKIYIVAAAFVIQVVLLGMFIKGHWVA